MTNSEVTISYDEIQNCISKFTTTKSNLLTEIQNTIDAINTYKSSGIVLSGGSYDEELNSISSKMSEDKSVLEQNCDRITKYLTTLANQAQENVNHLVTEAEAFDTFQATEVVKKG